jgi:hypothetical protein
MHGQLAEKGKRGQLAGKGKTSGEKDKHVNRRQQNKKSSSSVAARGHRHRCISRDRIY